MRLWLKDSERRPDPAPAKTDDRTALFVGTAGWLVALVVLLFFAGPLTSAGGSWLLITCVIGVVLGLLGLLYVGHRKT
jgi:hypothetical protein